MHGCPDVLTPDQVEGQAIWSTSLLLWPVAGARTVQDCQKQGLPRRRAADNTAGSGCPQATSVQRLPPLRSAVIE